jgi:dipeptidyl aminopeptidase/acylaminoacyl peptidase
MMKVGLLIIVGFLVFSGCCPKENKKESPLIGKPVLDINNDLMTPKVLWAFGRISEPELSPDKSMVLFNVAYYDISQNKGNRELWIIKSDGTGKKQITQTPFSEYQAMWTPDGKRITYISAESGEMQLYNMKPDGSDRRQLTEVQGGITGYRYSPDMKYLLYTAEVYPQKEHNELYEGLPKATGRIYSDHMYRHWDTWVESWSHIFIADNLGGTISSGRDIMYQEPYESPMKPFGGMEQIAWSPDSKTVAYTCKRKKGVQYTLSTNSDIYLYDVEKGTTSNLTEGMMGFDVTPVFSPDGKRMAWQSMARDGYESDKVRIFVLSLENGVKTDYSRNFDQNAEGLAWSDDSQSIWLISDWHATDEIYQLTLADGKIRKVTEGIHNYTMVIPAGDRLIATRMSMSKPVEIYSVDPVTGKDTEISLINHDLLEKLTMGSVQKRWIRTSDNKDMLTWIIFPPHFDSTKRYPALLFCEGGPQSTVSQFWSYRWNFQIMAANGYIIVAPNRRGLPGFGQEWLEQISGDYGGQNMKDYLSAIDAMAKEPYIDKEKLGCVGASYGGFSVYWLAGNHNKRFKAFIAHDGMFNLESQYLETDEMWFVNWDLGGPFWDKANGIAQRSYTTSPHRYVRNWDTPILVIHSELDYRIAVTQGMQAFNAALLRGIPAEFLYFPNENHWVLKPQNGILWQRTFFLWLDRWLK